MIALVIHDLEMPGASNVYLFSSREKVFSAINKWERGSYNDYIADEPEAFVEFDAIVDTGANLIGANEETYSGDVYSIFVPVAVDTYA